MNAIFRCLLGVVLGAAAPSALHAQFPPPQPQVPAPPQPPQPPPRPAGPVLVNAIAATVNGRAITTSEVNMAIAPVVRQLLAEFPRGGQEFERRFREVRKNALQELIDRQIILDEFRKLEAKGANIRDHVINDDVKRTIRELYNNDEEAFREELKRNRMTMDGYRRMTREKVIVQAMRQEQFADAPPPLPDEVRKEYSEMGRELRDVTGDKVTFRKIFIPRLDRDNPLATPDSQLALAEDLARRIRAGEDIAALAKVHSKDAYAEEGGLQENVSRLDLSAEFAAIIFEAKVGELKGPLQDPAGFTLVIPTRIDLAPPPPLDGKVRELVEARVQRKKTNAQYEKWIEGRRKQAMIRIMKVMED